MILALLMLMIVGAVLSYCFSGLLFLPFGLRALPKDEAEREQWRKESRL